LQIVGSFLTFAFHKVRYRRMWWTVND